MWLDQLDIEPGTPWDRAVEDAVTDCPRMLVILSPTSVNSDNVRDEVSFALSKQKRVIPVLYRDCDVPFRLARLQHIDFRTDYASGLKALLKNLGVKQQAVGAGGTTVSAVPNESQTDVSGADQRKRGAEPARLEQERRQMADEARLERKTRQPAKQARQEEERKQAAGRALREQESGASFLSKFPAWTTVAVAAGILFVASLFYWAWSQSHSSEQVVGVQKQPARAATSNPQFLASPQSGWAVGSGGTILHTEDGGGTWKPQTSGTRAYLASVVFATPHSGWAVGNDGHHPAH